MARMDRHFPTKEAYAGSNPAQFANLRGNMNIFVLDKDPVEAAKMHCNKHVIKMILETAQMLSAVLHKCGQPAPYKLTHKNHPCTLWAGKSLSNWLWLRELGRELHKEYQFRYGEHKTHKSFLAIEEMPVPCLPDIGLTIFPQAMPDEFKDKDVVTAYRNYYIGAKSHMLDYGKRDKPEWLNGKMA